MTAVEKAPIPVQGYAENGEFLEAKFTEVTLQLECAALRRRLAARGMQRWMLGQRNEEESVIPEEELQQHLECTEGELLQHHSVVEARAAVSERIPFVELANRCELSSFDQRALWLLFFKASSPQFREQYEYLEMARARSEDEEELRIGNLLELLSYTSIASTLRMRSRFSVDAPLFRHHLVRMSEWSADRPSILDVEIHLPQRIVSMISGDKERYISDSPCLVESPVEDIDHVVLDNGMMSRLLKMVDHHGELFAQRLQLGIGAGISYGRGLSILEYGPPGTGKTLMARALAHRVGKPLVSMTSRSDTGATELEYLFREARLQDGIVFIDECESLSSAESDELRVLLRELEQFDGIAIMATNRPQDLVEPLDRRFTLKVPFALPTAEARQRIWELHLGKVPLADDVDLSRLARDYPIAGGYIKNAAQAAVSEALGRDDGLQLEHADLDQACQLQTQHVGEDVRGAAHYKPTLRTTGILLPDELQSRLSELATGLGNLRTQCDDWGLEVSELDGIRVLFQGEDYATLRAAADAVAAQMERQVICFSLSSLMDPSSSRVDESYRSPASTIRNASRAGQVVLLTDARGLLGQADSTVSVPVLELLSQVSGMVFVVSLTASMPASRCRGVFHEVVTLRVANADMRERQWQHLLGSKTSSVDMTQLAQRIELQPGQMQMALELAVLKAASQPVMELTTELLLSCAHRVTREDVSGRLFG
jgi:DNA polymerase III delta prime subunit